VADGADEVVDRDLAAKAQGALARLDESRRRAVEHAVLGSDSYRSAARALGIPEGTLKARVRRALRELRDSVPAD
jgi:RNA polymerase sigma-70 factor (ECF subfamily)